MVLRAKMVAQSLTVDSLSKAPCVSINSTATCGKRRLSNDILIHCQVHKVWFKSIKNSVTNQVSLHLLITSSPDGTLQIKGSLHSKIPVVSRSDPPLQLNPSNGESSSPNQSGCPCRNIAENILQQIIVSFSVIK
jgi:hypothetical protein